jgi:hypothetical protein
MPALSTTEDFMHTTAIRLAALGFALLLLSACGGEDAGGGDSTLSATTPTAEAVPIEGRIPDGRYARTLTAADAEAAGLSSDLAKEFLGSDGELPVAFVFDGDRFQHLVTNDAGVEELGDLGTLSYDEEGRIVMTSESTGCPGCIGEFEWTIEADSLTLTDDEMTQPDAFVVTGPYTREAG